MRKATSLWCIGATICVAVGIYGFLWQWSRSGRVQRDANNFHTCLECMLEIGKLPRLMETDANGVATVSWRLRVLQAIKPISREGSDLRKSWKDASNKRFREMSSPLFCFYGDSYTSIMAIAGKDSAFEQEFHEIESLRDDSLLIVEVKQKTVNWIEPSDLQLDDLAGANRLAGDVLPSSENVNGFLVGFADGSVWRVPNSTPLHILADFADVRRTPQKSREEVFGDRLVYPASRKQTGKEVKEIWGRTPIDETEPRVDPNE